MTARISTRGIERCVGRCGGRPVIAGTRLTTATIFSCFMGGWSLATIAEQYPSVTPEQIEAALRFECCLVAKTTWAVEFAGKRLGRDAAVGDRRKAKGKGRKS